MSAIGRAERRQRQEVEDGDDQAGHLAVAPDVTHERSEQHSNVDVGAEGGSLRSVAASQAQGTERAVGQRGVFRHADQKQMEHSDVDRSAAPSQGSTSQRPAVPSPNPSLTPSLATWDTRAVPSPQPTQDPLVGPADFRPFFTLIESPPATFHHPTVHYIFSDDEDQESVLTSAALNAITQQDGSEDTARGGEAEERVVLLDLQADGRTVAEIKSLSGEWQSLQAEIGQAPSWGGGGDGGLMVRIQGKEGDEGDEVQGEGGGLEGLVERFARGLGSLDEVLGVEQEKTEAED